MKASELDGAENAQIVFTDPNGGLWLRVNKDLCVQLAIVNPVNPKYVEVNSVLIFPSEISKALDKMVDIYR